METGGQGPGELAGPTAIDIDEKGKIFVVDVRNYRIQIFSPEGKHSVLSLKLEDTPSKFKLLGDNYLMLNSSIVIDFDDSGKKMIDLLKIVTSGGEELVAFCKPKNYNDALLNRWGNRISFAIDKNNYI